MDKIAYEEMLEFASLGAKVMQVRSVELGMVHNVRIFVRSSFESRRISTHRSRCANSFATKETSWNSRSSPA